MKVYDYIDRRIYEFIAADQKKETPLIRLTYDGTWMLKFKEYCVASYELGSLKLHDRTPFIRKLVPGFSDEA